LSPQSVNIFGGSNVPGRNAAAAAPLLEEALAREAAGMQLLGLECVPAALATRAPEPRGGQESGSAGGTGGGGRTGEMGGGGGGRG
ncbi:3-methyl-2-oxobutanoate hydroxymethyltransferase, partial [Erwinia amylovora]|uniref:3-methyl-2-oxobutanoate hydroxymethyltransferase n=1 Tax=Erwinia amylovora TaxID=552 RepID=UPI00200B172A